MIEYHIAFVVLLVGTEAFFSSLSVLNTRYAETKVRKNTEMVTETLGVEDIEELLDYHRTKTGFSLLQTWVGLTGLLFILYTDLFADGVKAIESLGMPMIVEGIIFVVGAVVVLQLFSIPFDLFSTFVIEEIFDFNNQTPKLWVKDFVIGLLVAGVISAVLVAPILWFISETQYWWVAGWALFVAFSLVMMVVYPRVIAPLFNDFEKIEEGELREGVEDVFERAGFSCEQVYEMDASRRSSKSNAYFVGFGRAKRVVLFDTLIEQMGIDEIKSVLAHELAHWKKKHIWKFILLSAVQYGVVFGILGFLVSQNWLYEMFGVPSNATYAHLALAALWIYPVNRLVSPLNNYFSLKYEREADTFATEVMGPQPMIDALSNLASENLANPFPHPWYETFHYDHPPIPERISYIREKGGIVDDSDAETTAAD